MGYPACHCIVCSPDPPSNQVTLLEVTSTECIPGGTRLCDNTWTLRTCMSPARNAGAKNENKREAIYTVAESLGLEVTERLVSRTWAEMEGLL